MRQKRQRTVQRQNSGMLDDAIKGARLAQDCVQALCLAALKAIPPLALHALLKRSPHRLQLQAGRALGIMLSRETSQTCSFVSMSRMMT
jgi:hypothetical protein